MDTTKLCKACGRTLPLDDFYHSQVNNGPGPITKYSNNCRTCHKKYYTEQNKLRARQIKIKAVELLGGKCQKCYGVFHPASFDFHHRDPETKCFSISEFGFSSWKKLEPELKKCDLLCANCHRELEAGYAA